MTNQATGAEFAPRTKAVLLDPLRKTGPRNSLGEGRSQALLGAFSKSGPPFSTTPPQVMIVSVCKCVR